MVVNEKILVSALLVAFDLGGTFVFALSGAAAGVKNRLDSSGFWSYPSRLATRVASPAIC